VAYRASVVVAIEHSTANLPAIVSNLGLGSHPEVEFVFCHTGRADPVASLAPGQNVRSIRCLDGARIPHMWRDGILSASAESVGLLSAHCIPTKHWMTGLLSIDLRSTEAAAGGFFTNSRDATARDWAIYLLRYVRFSRPRDDDRALEVAADNAVYKRSEVLACRDLLERGFWEPEYHKRFFARGLRLLLTRELEVVHTNRYSAREFAAQRRDHGYAFGRDRGRSASTLRLVLYALTSPLIPAVLYAKVVGGAIERRWIGRLPRGTHFWLLFFILNWALGEARGLFGELGKRLRLSS